VQESWTYQRFVSTKNSIMEEFWIPLILRMVVTAAVVVAATAAAERVGPFWAALIGAFPTSAGPAYVMLALKEDAAFVAASAVSSLAAMIAIAPCTLAIIFLATRANAVATVLGGFLVWVAFAIPITQLTWTPLVALACNLLVYGLCFWVTRNMRFDLSDLRIKKAKWFELPARAIVIGLFVASVVTLSDLLGPIGMGLGAVFPIVFLSLSVVLHMRLGGTALAMTMHTALRVVSIIAFALLVLHYGVLWWGEAIGLSLAFLVSIIWALLFVMLNRSEKRDTMAL